MYLESAVSRDRDIPLDKIMNRTMNRHACIQDLIPIGELNCFELIDYPGPGFVLVLHNPSDLEPRLQNVVALTEYLQREEIAHNVFITWESRVKVILLL